MSIRSNYIQYVNGQKIGECIYVRELTHKMSGKQKIRQALFRCRCGREFVGRISAIINGNTASCGCLRKQVAAKLNFKHGCGARGRETPEFRAWSAMIARCENELFHQYKDYGGRGIKVCERWRSSFVNFLEDMGKKPSSKYSLDRIDNDKDYCKGNCRWGTKEEQIFNRRNTVLIEFDGQSKSLKHWANELGMSYSALHKRIKRGTIEAALKMKKSA